MRPKHRKDNIKKDLIAQIGNLIKIKFTTKASALIDDYIYQYGEDCYIQLEQGRLLSALKSYDKAIEVLTKLYNDNPANIGYVIHLLGHCYLQTGKLQEAIEIYQSIDNTTYDDKNYVYYELARCYYDLSQDNESERYYKYILCNTKGDKLKELSKYGLVQIYMLRQEYEKAEKLLNSIICGNDNSLSAKVLLTKSKLAKLNGQYDKQEELLTKIYECYDENYYPAYSNLLYVKIKRNLKELNC